MDRELYCKEYDKYVKELTEGEAEECIDWPVCSPQDCEYCEEHLFDDEGNRVD